MTARVWKDGTRRGIAYIEGKENAERVLAAAGRTGVALPEVAMAVYQDRRGRAFAWQFVFDIGHWEQVQAACVA